MEYDATDPTGVRETSTSVQKATLDARRTKAAAATDAYIEKHKTLKEVAKKFGYPSPHAALVAIEKHMAEELRTHPRSIPAMREMAGRRLEQLLRSVNKKALDPDNPEHLNAVVVSRGIIETWSKNYGVAAPQQLIVSNPTQEAIEAMAQELLAAGTPQLPVGDIFGDDADDSEILALEAKQADVVDAELVEESANG